MSKHTAPPIPDDAELAAWLGAHADLLDRYRALPQSEPPQQLDAAILAGARHAARHRRRPAWWIPVASAASLVAAAGIGWRVYLANPAHPGIAPAASAPARQVLEVDLYPQSERERALETALNPPAAPAALEDAAPAGKAAPKLDSANAAAATDPSRAEADSSERTHSRDSFAEPFTQSDHASLGRVPEQRAAPGAARGNDQPDAATAASPAEAKRPTKSEAEASAVGRSETAPAGQPQAAATAIAGIEALLAQGRIVEARRAIRQFRSHYPDHPLPAAWRRYER